MQIEKLCTSFTKNKNFCTQTRKSMIEYVYANIYMVFINNYYLEVLRMATIILYMAYLLIPVLSFLFLFNLLDNNKKRTQYSVTYASVMSAFCFIVFLSGQL